MSEQGLRLLSTLKAVQGSQGQLTCQPSKSWELGFAGASSSGTGKAACAGSQELHGGRGHRLRQQACSRHSTSEQYSTQEPLSGPAKRVCSNLPGPNCEEKKSAVPTLHTT